MTAIAAIHVAKKQLGLDDDTARDLYERVTGKRSLRDMTPADHERVVQELRDRGFKKASSGARKPLQGKYAAKLQALWIAAWNLGIVRNRDDKALLAFVERQTGLSHVRFLHDPIDASKSIEALKGWMAREGGVDWSNDVTVAEWLKPAGAKIALAQWQILSVAKAVDPKGFRKFVWDNAKPLDQMAEGDWKGVMNRLGEMVRRARS